jgi:PAS domain S-box-containing protein
MFGLHQCAYPRVWTPQEERLFQEIGRRLADALTGLLMFRTLRESERRLDEAQRIAHVGYWDQDLDTGRITLSDEACRIFGLQPEERVVDLTQWHEQWLALIHPEDRPRIAEVAAAALRGGPPYDVEYRVVRPGGEVRIIYSRGEVTWDDSGRPRRMFGMMQDITERKRAEQHLVAQHSVTRILAEVATVEEATPKILQALCERLEWDLGTLWRIDQEAGVLRCAQMWRKPSVEATQFAAANRASTFRPGRGLPGQVWASRAPACIPDVAHDPGFLRAHIAAREGLHAAFAFPILLGSEVLGVIDFVSREIRQPDQDLLDMMASVGSQIGQFIERKRAEESLRQAQAELSHMARLTTLGELTASIAHEVNQPLGAIVTNGQACLRLLARESPDLHKSREVIERMISNGMRASAVITRIRALAQKAPPHKDWLDLNATIRDVLALARSAAHRHGVAVETHLAEQVPLVRADRIQLQQVLLNLIINAIEAMSGVGDGPRELAVQSDPDTTTPGVRVTVRDSGPGLDPQHLAHLFDAFYTTKTNGLGLGLAISRRIVEAHGGGLWASANVPHGAVFQFTVPIGSEEGA